MRSWNVGSMVVAVAVICSSCFGAMAFPYSTGFESPEWTATGAWSDAPGQNGWTGASTTVLDDAGKAYEGDQCLRFGFYNGYGGWMKTPEITGELETGLLEIEVMLNHGTRDGGVAGDSSVTTQANDGYNMFAFTLSASSGYFEANGTSTGVAFAENTWYKINILIDQGTSGNGNKANFYVNDNLVAENVASGHWASTGLKYVGLSGGSHQSGATGDHYTYMDNLVIAIPEPMTMTLLVIGGLCGVVRKRRRA